MPGLQTGAPLSSPDNPEAPGIARPSSLVNDEPSGGGEREGSMPEPNRQMTEVVSQVREIETKIEGLAQAFPAAASHLRKTKDSLRRALQQIVASGSGEGRETPSPRMVG